MKKTIDFLGSNSTDNMYNFLFEKLCKDFENTDTELLKILYIGTTFQSAVLLPFLKGILQLKSPIKNIQIVTAINKTSNEIFFQEESGDILFSDETVVREGDLDTSKSNIEFEFIPDFRDKKLDVAIKKSMFVDFNSDDITNIVNDESEPQDTSEERIMFTQAMSKESFSIIFCLFENHFELNWRVGITNLLRYLKPGGSFVFAEANGKFERLDGNFKNVYQNDEYENKLKLKEFDLARSEIHYWKPEISFSNYRELRYQIGRVFESVVDGLDYNFESSKSENGFFENADVLELDKEDIINIIEKNKLSYFRLGLYENKRFINAQIRKLSNSEVFKENDKLEFDINLQIYIAKKFNLGWLNNYTKRKWNFSSLLKDLQQINDNSLNILGQKALDVMASHDMILPLQTRYLALVEWTDSSANEWEYPIHFLINDKKYQRNINKLNLVTNIANWLHYEQIVGCSILKSVFQNSKRKNIVRFICLSEEESEQLKLRDKLTETSDKKRKIKVSSDFIPDKVIWYDYSQDGKGNCEELNIYFFTSGVIFNDDLLLEIRDLFKDEMDNIGIIENQLLKKNALTRYKLGSSFGSKIRDIKSKVQVSVHNPKSGNIEHDEEVILDILGINPDKIDQFYLMLDVVIYSHFHTFKSANKNSSQICNRYELTFFPSAIIEKDDKEGNSTEVDGLGGLILYEERLAPEANETLKGLYYARNKALSDATNLIFYKASIVSHVGHDFKRHARKAAIAAINARNSAHITGSHILPDLINTSYNSEEKRYYTHDEMNNNYKHFFRYLMRRGEYIAQLASEFPTWSVPTWFTKELMCEFYRQFCVLDSIASAEEIRSYAFSKKVGDDYIDLKEVTTKPLNEREYIHGRVINNKIEVNSNEKMVELTNDDSNLYGIINEMNGRRVKLGKNFQPLQHKLIIKVRKRYWQEIDDDGKLSDRYTCSKYLNDQIACVINLAKKAPDKLRRRYYFGIIVKSENEIGLLYHNISSDGISSIMIDKHCVLKLTFDDGNKYIEVIQKLITGTRIILEAELSEDQLKLEKIKFKELSSIVYLVDAKFNSGLRLSDGENDIDVQNLINNDIQISVPGGITGNHAFYIIMENIIRNSAKHNWYQLTSEEKNGRNLEVKIELEEKIIKGDENKKGESFYICKIWTNTANLRYKDGVKTNEIASENISFLKNDMDALSGLINEYLSKDIISKNGEHEKKHLGISEIKLNAAFLSNLSLFEESNIGVKENIILDDKSINVKGYIKASQIWEVDENQLVPRLGYRFKLLKPKEFLIISDLIKRTGNSYLERENVETLTHEEAVKLENRNSKKKHFLEMNEKMTSGLDYEFCLIINDENFTFEMKDLDDLYNLSLCSLIKIYFNAYVDQRIKIKCFDAICSILEGYPYRLFFIGENDDELIDSIIEIIRNGFNENNELKFISSRIVFWKKKLDDISVMNDECRTEVYDKWVELFMINSFSYNLSIFYNIKGNNEIIIDKYYSENAVTIPHVFKKLDASIPVIDNKFNIKPKAKKNLKHDRITDLEIQYIRHLGEGKNKSIRESFIYRDNLSGKTNSFNVFNSFKNTDNYIDKKFINFLYESALSTVMIIDERIMTYLNDYFDDFAYERKCYSYSNRNIIIPYRISVGEKVLYEREDKYESKSGYKKEISFKNDFDADVHINFYQPVFTNITSMNENRKDNYTVNTLVIHQAYLDKISGYHQLSDSDKSNSTDIDSIIKKMKIECKLPSIIVSSGRGRGKYINFKYCKYVPFSILEYSLLNPNPDKLSLMNMLFKTLN